MVSEKERDEKIGLLAGSGTYPIRVAKGFRSRGVQVVTLGVIGEASSELSEVSDVFKWTRPTRLAAAIRFFRKHGVTRATMAGKIRLERYFSRGLWLRNFPDYRLLRAAIPFFITHRKDCRCDSILGEICREFAKDGIHFIPATDELPELLVNAGILTEREPTETEWRDIHFGWRLAQELGRWDVGQSVLVRNQTVVAIEAMEHTDEAIHRAGELSHRRGFVLVKTAKPSQDMRFDVPTIGLGTLEALSQWGGTAIAIEANRTLLVELRPGEFLEMANRLGIAVVAMTS